MSATIPLITQPVSADRTQSALNGLIDQINSFLSGMNPESVDITGGTIDNTVIGGSIPAAGAFTTLTGISGSINNDTIATLTAAQTLTNKIFTSPVISGGTIDGAVIGGLTPAAATFTSLTSGAAVITATSANAFSVGQNGTTSPAFNIDTSTASATTGINIKSATAGSGVTLSALSSNANENFYISPLNAGSIIFKFVSTSSYTFAINNFSFSPGVANTASVSRFLLTPAADGALTASTNAIFFKIANATRTHAAGALTLQQDNLVQGATHAFASASTATDVAALSLTLPIAGTNATFTNSHGLLIQSAGVGTGVSNSYGITINAASGATNNYAAQFLGGNVGIGTSSPTSLLTVAGTIASTVSTGTAPFAVSSTTNVANLNASLLNGNTFAAPGNIGSTTPGNGIFNQLTANNFGILDGIYLGGDQINQYSTNGLDYITINFVGYLNGTTQYRNFQVCDGKQNPLLLITGSTQISNFYGQVQAPSILFTSTSGIIGSTTNDSAAAGSVGEYISASVALGSAVSLTTATTVNVTSISLTAGDWDVWGTVAFALAGSTVMTTAQGAINTTSATLPGLGTASEFYIAANFLTGGGFSHAVGVSRISVASTTTVYLVVQSQFTTSTNAAYGFIGARRVR